MTSSAQLIDCPACGKQVSPNASSCPGCGEPLRERDERPVSLSSGTHVARTAGRYEALGTLLVIGGMLVAMAADGLLDSVGKWAAGAGLLVFLIGRFK